jgi:CubicO group peptidase (beta-lactamase class C family)
MLRSLLAVALFTAVFTSLVGCSGKSQEFEVPAITDNIGEGHQLSWLSRAAINSMLRYRVWRGSRSGYVVLIARDGQPVYATTAGWADIESQTPMTLDTRMRFASMTKPVTAVAAHILIEEGKLNLDDPVEHFIPEFANLRVASSHTANSDGTFATVAIEQPLTVRHLLMFSSGIGPGRSTEETDLLRYWKANGPRSHTEGSMQQRVAQIGRLPLFEQPATAWRYGWSADVMASIVEIASGQAFDEFVEARIFAPLGMSETRFRYADPRPQELATVYTQDQHGDLVTILPSSDTHYPQGGSGLVSTAPDYMRFALMLYNRGEYQGVRVLREDSVEQMTALHVSGGVLKSAGIDGMGWGLGMSVVADADKTQMGDTTGDFGWSGYFGTTFWVSPESGLVGVVLSQNQPGPHSGLPLGVYLVQGLALFGL